ncbi:hypothetical protein D8X55_00370 [Malacoplasma penetrans]|nr:hypothetical protein [Malacoplasma penetrans]RXY97372.1 hypothetical protein D8X55_00370 [Malacoplasma penetrans]
MDYSKIKKLYLEQTKTVITLLDNQEFVGLLTSNELLRTNFVDQISVLRFLEKKLTDTKLIEKEISDSKKKKTKLDLIEIKDLDKSDIYIKKFKEITSSSPEFNEFSEIKKTENIKDIIKYLNVFLKNTFNKDLDYFLKNKSENETVRAEKIENDNFDSNTNQNPHSNTSQPNGGPGMFGNMFGGQGPMFRGWPNYEQNLQEQLLIIASTELKNQINSGKFYLYKTKPKIMLYLKNIIGCLSLFVSAIWIIVMVMQIITTSLQSGNLSALWYGDPSASTPIVLAPGNTFFTYILHIFLIGCFGFYGYKHLVNKKNENILYGFDKRTAMLLTFVMISVSGIFIFYLANWIPYIDDVKNFTGGAYSSQSIPSRAVQNSSGAVVTFQIFVWTLLSGLVMFAFLIISYIFAWVYMPKIDEERIRLKTQEIIEQLKKGDQFKSAANPIN